MISTTPSIRTLLNWLGTARTQQNLSPKELRRLEYTIGLLMARHVNAPQEIHE
jgi:hypothetical protein